MNTDLMIEQPYVLSLYIYIISSLIFVFYQKSIIDLSTLGIIIFKVLMMVYLNPNIIASTFFHNKFITLDYFVV